MDMVARLCAPRPRHGRRPHARRGHAGRGRARPARRRGLSRRRAHDAADRSRVDATSSPATSRDLPIVRGVDLAVRPGEIVVVLGPNGAGKSTFVKAIAGLVPIHSAAARLGGADITAAAGPRAGPPRPRLRAADREHLRHAVDRRQSAARRRHPAARPSAARASTAMYALFPDLAARPPLARRPAVRRPAADAGRGARADRRARGADPRRAVGRAVAEDRRRGLRASWPSIRATGVTIVLVEQNVKAALAIADRAVVLVEGRDAPRGPRRRACADDPVVGRALSRRPARRGGGAHEPAVRRRRPARRRR